MGYVKEALQRKGEAGSGELGVRSLAGPPLKGRPAGQLWGPQPVLSSEVHQPSQPGVAHPDL